MGFIWLSATIVCALMTALFFMTLVYYFQHYSVTWRVIGLLSVIAFWVVLTQSAFLKFKGHISKRPATDVRRPRIPVSVHRKGRHRD